MSLSMLAKINPNSPDPKDKIILVCDGAAWHKSGSLRIPENAVHTVNESDRAEMERDKKTWF